MTERPDATSVLFICMGNICRSPLAESIFRHKMIQRGVADRFSIDSAGTGGWHAGESPDHRMSAVAATHGVPVDGSARKVGHTMGKRITDMNHGQAVSANLATGLLVIIASQFGMPVSTTHVSVGSLFGIGVATKSAKHRSVATIALAWLITLPCAGVIAALTYLMVR